MTLPDDSVLTTGQLATVRRHADRLLQDAAALNRFPTPIDDIMSAANLVVLDDEILSAGVVQQFVRRARAGIATIKSALSKVLGLFEANERLVVIDRAAPGPKVPFIKLHEAGHGTLPHQCTAYRLVQDCEQSLDAEVTELFEREANVFASEVLFQGAVFDRESRDLEFGLRAPIALAKKFGASNYSTFRRYVATNDSACCVVVLEPAVRLPDGEFESAVRRVVMSKSFAAIYDYAAVGAAVNGAHSLACAVPRLGRRMTRECEAVLVDRNRDERICLAEGFDTKHQTLVLIRDCGLRRKAGVLVPACGPKRALSM